MKILVTGGAGFVGTNLIKKLVTNGHEVVSLDDYSTGTKENHVNGCHYTESTVEHIQYYFGMDDSFDLVYHLAGLSRIQPSFENPQETFDANTVGTQRVLEWARKKGLKVIYAGSSSKHHDPYQSPYATCKYLGEELCKLYKKTYNMDIEICRFYNVYGPHEVIEGDWAAVIGIWRRQVEVGEPITIVGDGEQKRDFTHVHDIVDALLELQDVKTGRFLFNEWELGTGMNYSINEVADMFVKYGGATKTYIPDQHGNYRETIRESDKSIEFLNWEPKDRLEDYIKSLYK
jgi:UDP-glucose 4-epimerase